MSSSSPNARRAYHVVGSLVVSCVLVVVASTPAAAKRTPPMALDGENGVWIGAGDRFIQQTRDRWSVYPTPGTVNDIAVDQGTVWLATDEGAVRFDVGSQNSTIYDMDSGLPSQAVATVAVDDQYVWIGTNKGLVRYRKLDQTFRTYTDEDGLPHRAVNDALPIGRQIWFGTRGGLAVYDPTLDGLRSYTTRDGLASDYIEELYQVGDDLWCLTDEGLSRFRIKSHSFTNFSFDEIGGEEIRTFVLNGDNVWIGTENGLIVFTSAADSFRPFPQQSSLESRSIVGVEVLTDYIFIATDEEVVQYHVPNRSIRRFTEADGLSRREGIIGTVLGSGMYTLIFEDGAESYDVQRDLWTTRSFEATATRPPALRVFGRLDSSTPYDLVHHELSDQRYATARGGLGFGQRFGGRSLDASVDLDYGQLETSGIRDLQYKAEYLGTSDDPLREVRAGDKLELRRLEEGLERSLLLEGANARVATPGEEPRVSGVVEGGRRRGANVRDFLTGPRRDIYELSQRYILPGTERVYVDGELLASGTDYTIIYPAGQLAFLDPERVDDLSIIEVDYEYDLMSRKGLGVLSLLDLLPADREVGDWTRSGEARLISEESGLYQQIDGAAPKYIDRGWERSVYAEYRQGSRSIRVAIHDMGSEGNAAALYDYDLPPAREPVADEDNLILDVGLANSYAAKAYAESYYFELSIDEKSDAAKQSLKLFAIQVLNRGDNAGASSIDASREWLASARAAASPYHGMEIGARLLALHGTDDAAGEPGRRLILGTADARYERALGGGARLTAYSELGGSRSKGDDELYGWGAMGRLRLSHPALEGTMEGRWLSPDYQPIGTTDTLLGKLRGEARLAATAYPKRWLPTTVFFTRQRSLTESNGVGILQHALARAQLNRDRLPVTGLTVGHTLVDGESEQTNRLRLVGQSDYDVPTDLLRRLHLKRVALRALYGLSAATTEQSGHFAHGDRVQLVRLEGKLAPTATESAYALFRSRRVERQESEGDPFDLGVLHWELNSGARSEIVRGLIPQVNYTVFFDDDRESSAVDVRAAKSSVTGELGIYPGQYWKPLIPVVLVPRYSVANTEQADDGIKTLFFRSHRFDNRAVYAGLRKFEVESYQLYEFAVAGEDRLRQARKLELRNRVIYRPIYVSPITFRYDHVGQRARNDLDLDPDAPGWAHQTTDEGIVEWLMRWTRSFTTKLRSGYLHARTRDQLVAGANPGDAPTLQHFLQHRISGETELRYLTRDARLYLVQRNRVYRWFGHGEGAADSVVFEIAGGLIWMVSDKIYLDSELTYRQTHCFGGLCTRSKVLEPRVFFTFNL